MCVFCMPYCDRCKPKFAVCQSCGQTTSMFFPVCVACGEELSEGAKQKARETWQARNLAEAD